MELIKNSIRNGIIMGTFSGILGGLFNVGRPPLVIYYFSAMPDKMEYNASIQATFAFSSIYTVFLHFLYDNINMMVIKLAVVGIIAITIGCTAGLWIFKRLNMEIISKAIYSFMAIMGVMMITKG